MGDVLTVRPVKRLLLRICAIALPLLSIPSGIMLAYQDREFWPLIFTVLLTFIGYGLWTKSNASLEIRSDGILLGNQRRRVFLDWSMIQEFAPGDGIERNRVEFTLKGEIPLKQAYSGLAQFKLRHPRYLPDTFGMSSIDLSNLLNRKKQESEL